MPPCLRPSVLPGSGTEPHWALQDTGCPVTMASPRTEELSSALDAPTLIWVREHPALAPSPTAAGRGHWGVIVQKETEAL